MNSNSLQRWIDEFLETSGQQWLLRVVAVLAPVGAVLAAAAANERWWPFGLFVATVLAIASAIRPDTHTALVVVVAIVWHWSTTVDDLGTPWLPVASVCLLVFHAVTALSATMPIGGELPLATVKRWLRRVAIVAAATVSMWVLVLVLERREAEGNGLLTGAALAIVALGAVFIRSRDVESPT